MSVLRMSSSPAATPRTDRGAPDYLTAQQESKEESATAVPRNAIDGSRTTPPPQRVISASSDAVFAPKDVRFPPQVARSATTSYLDGQGFYGDLKQCPLSANTKKNSNIFRP